MKTLQVVIFSFLVTMSSCTAQNKKETGSPSSKGESLAEASTNSLKPDVRFKVNKKYDEKGKLIAFDSTYSYSYTSPGVSPLSLKEQEHYFKKYIESSDNFFDFPDVLNNETGFAKFFDDPFFDKQLEQQQKWMSDMQRQFNSFHPPASNDKKQAQKNLKPI